MQVTVPLYKCQSHSKLVIGRYKVSGTSTVFSIFYASGTAQTLHRWVGRYLYMAAEMHVFDIYTTREED